MTITNSQSVYVIFVKDNEWAYSRIYFVFGLLHSSIIYFRIIKRNSTSTSLNFAAYILGDLYEKINILLKQIKEMIYGFWLISLSNNYDNASVHELWKDCGTNVTMPCIDCYSLIYWPFRTRWKMANWHKLYYNSIISTYQET